MNDLLEVKSGMLALTNILSSVWLGDWDQYETILQDLPEEIKEQLPFHAHYNREEADLWHQNHFEIPGDYFVSPYYSTYSAKEKEDHEETNKELLCLIGIFEKVGYYYPLEKKMYPDHIGSLNVFLGSILREEIAAEKNEDHGYLKQLQELREEIVAPYLIPLERGIKKAAENKIENQFLKEFISYYAEFIENQTEVL